MHASTYAHYRLTDESAEIHQAVEEGEYARAESHANAIIALIREEADKAKARDALARELQARQAALRWLHEKEGLCAAMLAANPGLSPEDITLCQDTGLGGTFGIVRIWAEIKKRR